MTLTVRYFAAFREAAGTGEEAVEQALEPEDILAAEERATERERELYAELVSELAGHAQRMAAAAARAVTELAHAVATRVTAGDRRLFPEFPAVPFNLGTITGGTADNMIAEQCELIVGFRQVPGSDPEELLAELETRDRDVGQSGGPGTPGEIEGAAQAAGEPAAEAGAWTGTRLVLDAAEAAWTIQDVSLPDTTRINALLGPADSEIDCPTPAQALLFGGSQTRHLADLF